MENIEELNTKQQPEGGMEQAPAPEPQMMPEDGGGKKSFGPIFGIIIIVILIILAGFYFWGNQLEDTAREEATTEEVGGDVDTTSSTDIGEPLSTSDEIADIEADLDATDLENLDAELENIDAEFIF